MSGPKRRQHDAMRKCHACTRHLPGNTAQRTLAWSLHACTHVKSLLLLPTKLASSAARTASFVITTECARLIRPHLIPAICAASHSGRRLNGFDSYSVLAIASTRYAERLAPPIFVATARAANLRVSACSLCSSGIVLQV